MHVEVPKAKKWKEFSSEYLMIVVSIITALALEHAVMTYHYRHLAHEASVRIEAELRANQQEIEDSLKHNQGMQQRVEKLRKALLADLKRGTPDQLAIEHMLALDDKGLNLSIHGPGVRHEAWDVAVANQAASYIEPARLERYAQLYAHMRDVDTVANGSGNRFLDNAQLTNVFTDVELGKAQARDVLQVLQQMIWSYNGADGNLESLRDDFAQGFGQVREIADHR